MSQLEIERLLIDQSLFYELRSSSTICTSLQNSIQKAGILSPIIITYYDNCLHVVDGFKRLAIAIETGFKSVPVWTLEPQVTELTALSLRIHQQDPDTFGFLDKFQYIQWALLRGYTLQELSVSLFPALGFVSSPKMISFFQKLSAFSPEVLQFCRKKKLSYKQCQLMVHYDSSLIEGLLHYQDSLYLSTSTFLELLSLLFDLTRLESKDCLSYLQSLESQFLEHETPQLRSNALKTLLDAKRHPTLTQTNNVISDIVAPIQSREHIDIHWDKTLEHKQVDLSICIRSVEDWHSVSTSLTDPKLTSQIGEALDQL